MPQWPGRIMNCWMAGRGSMVKFQDFKVSWRRRTRWRLVAANWRARSKTGCCFGFPGNSPFRWWTGWTLRSRNRLPLPDASDQGRLGQPQPRRGETRISRIGDRFGRPGFHREIRGKSSQKCGTLPDCSARELLSQRTPLAISCS